MKKAIFWIAIAALALSSCSKGVKSGLNDASKRFIDSYIQTYYPNATQTALGSYIIDSSIGTGTSVGTPKEHPYLYVNYTAKDLYGSVITTTDPDLAKKAGKYKKSTYCGPAIWNRKDNGLMAGFEDLVSTMNAGGVVEAVIPGWLLTNERRDSAKEYQDSFEESGLSSMYSIEVIDCISDLKLWEADSLYRYISRHFPGKQLSDSTTFGHYIMSMERPTEEAFKLDSTYYVNYVGRLLDGTVFDTNVADSAKIYDIYNAKRTYGPTTVVIKEQDGARSITFGGGSAINGFTIALDQMHVYEHVATVFYSEHGYGSSGSGLIPSYSPLRFDIVSVDKPKK